MAVVWRDASREEWGDGSHRLGPMPTRALPPSSPAPAVGVEEAGEGHDLLQ
jgi:hypothetical protein